MFRRFLPALAALVLAAPISAALLAPTPAAAAASVEAYTRLPALSQVRISPDGSKIAYIALVGDKRRLMIKTLSGQVLNGVELGVQKVRDIRWGDDTHVIITTAYYGDLGGLAQKQDFYTAQSYNIVTQKFALILGNSRGTHLLNDTTSAQLNVVSGPPIIRTINGKRTVFAAGFNKAYDILWYEIDLDTGYAIAKPNAGSLMDANGMWVATTDFHENTSNHTFTWRLVRRDGPGVKELWKEDGWTIESPSLLGFGRTQDTVLVGYPVGDGEEIWEVNLSDGKRKRLKIGDLGDNAQPIYQGLTGKLMGFEGLVENDELIYWLDETMGGTWDSIVAGFPNEHVRFVSATPDYSKIVVYTYGDKNPGNYLLVDVAAKKAFPGGSAYPDVKPEDVATVKYIHYKAADGTIIPAYLTLPNGRDWKNLPLIVLPHGGPGARDTPGFDWFAQPVASRGYAVLQPQYRGSTGYGKAHLEAGYGEWGKKMQTDLSDGVRYLAAEGIIDPKRVCIFGWSYGGYAAMAGPTIDPGIYRCAVAGAGVSDLNKMLSWERDRSGGKDSIVMRFWKRFMGASRISDGSLAAVSPLQQAARADAPMLIIHGKQDYTVPYEQSVFLSDALKRAGKPVELVILPNDDHYIDARSASRQQVFDLTIKFLETHNPPYP